MNEKNQQQQLERDLAWFSDLLLKDSERIKMPDSLLSVHLLSRLDETEAADRPKKLSKGRVLAMRVLPYAACFALILFGWNHLAGSTNQTATLSGGTSPEAASLSSVAQPMDAGAQAADETDAKVPAPEEPQAPMAVTFAASSSSSSSSPVPAADQHTATSYDEVYDSLQPVWEKQQNGQSRSMLTGGAVMAPAYGAGVMMNDSVKMESAAGVGGGGVYQTNVQVEGVDEADIIKTDGTYIYQYRFNGDTGGAQITIVTANGLKLLSTIELPQYADAQMYVSGDRLVVVQATDEKTVGVLTGQIPDSVSNFVGEEKQSSAASSKVEVIIPDYYQGVQTSITMTEAVVYDISSHQNPKETYRFSQDGYYVSSRLSDGTLYLVTDKELSYSVVSRGNPVYDLIPMVGEQQSARLIAPQDIVIPPYVENPNYAVVTALQLGSQQSSTKAVLGMANQIMMSADSLFLTASIADNEDGGWRSLDTGITRFSVAGGAIQYISSGRVDGTIDNQFSLDEYGGNLRIATTSVNDDGKSVNNLYVLDAQMKQLGAVEDLAEGERIYSVRYRGKTAYVVTYRETDPLFVIDLSDPQKPTVKGELKIPGFSEYLHPIDDNTLIGLGMNTITTTYGGVVEDGMKLSLFDVSDPAAPKETASYLLGNMGSTSEAINNHKAFLYYPQEKLIGFPAVIYTTSGAVANDPWSGSREVTFAGYLVIKVRDDGFDVVGTIPSAGEQKGFFRTDYNDAIERGLYIGKTLYTASASRLSAYSLDTFEKIGELVYER